MQTKPLKGLVYGSVTRDSMSSATFKQLTLRDMWYPELRKIKSARDSHSEVLAFFKALPRDLRRYVQTFHKSTGPTLQCCHCEPGTFIYSSQSSGFGTYWGYDGEVLSNTSNNILCRTCYNRTWCWYCENNVNHMNEYNTTTGKLRVCFACVLQFKDDLSLGIFRMIKPKHT